jgi:hypothetical protein
VVGVLDDGDAAVGVEAFEGLLLELGELVQFDLVRQAEFFEEDQDFPWVWTL